MARVIDVNDPDHPAPEWRWHPLGHVHSGDKWGWQQLMICEFGHCRYWAPEVITCRVAICYKTCRPLLPSEMSMYLLGGERALISYIAEEM